MAALVAIGAAVLPAAAEAQARGTVQATATVVETRHSFEALQAARSALEGQRAVATVAQVCVDRPVTRPNTVVVTIDYSLN
ncbi:MAG: hypothetical protein ACREMC_11815 [Gemmatimonadales bacterium]